MSSLDRSARSLQSFTARTDCSAQTRRFPLRWTLENRLSFDKIKKLRKRIDLVARAIGEVNNFVDPIPQPIRVIREVNPLPGKSSLRVGETAPASTAAA